MTQTQQAPAAPQLEVDLQDVNLSAGPIQMFDGVCNLCNGMVQYVLLHDRSQRIRFLSLQDPKAEAILARYNAQHERVSMNSLILLDNGKLYRESDAVLRLARHMGGWYKVVGMLGWLVPRFLRDSVYRTISRNRYRWFGKQDECMLPRPEWKARFV